MKNLKSIDFKALFIDHGEKMGFGVIVLTVLLIFLPGLSSGWGRFTQSPDELKTKIDQATASIDSPANSWPKAKQDQYVVLDFSDKASEISRGLDIRKYEFSTNLYWPLYRKKEKAKEPEYLAAQFVIAHAGTAAFAIKNTSGVEVPALAGEEMANSGESSLPENFKNPLAGPTGRGPGAPMMPAGAAAPPGAAPPSSAHGAAKSGGRKNSPDNSASSAMASYGMPGMAPGRGGGGSAARGVRYVAVRAIVPLKEQQEKVMRALNLTSREDASAFVEYTNFILERQAAIAGPDPWAGKWEVVKIDTALEMLEECDGEDPDPVPSELQDSVFTMVLPSRLMDIWGDHATHPNIKNFQVSPEEYEREMKLQRKLMEEYEKLELEKNSKTIVKGGLARIQNDIRGVMRQVSTSNQGMDVMKSMQQYMSAEGGTRGMAAAEIQSRLTASGRLYLFRYFDFDVQPGVAYRYRVKLKLKNPNFERPYEEVENPDFTRDKERETGWSNISSVAVVPESVHYFLKEVDRDPSQDEKFNKKSFASISFFEWDQKLGTLLSDTLKILTVGQFIGEPKKKTWVLDPGTPSLEEKEVPLTTEDVLIDARSDLALSPEMHPDLGLKTETGKGNAKAGMLPEALVVSSLGRLKEMDPLSEESIERTLAKRVSDERKAYEHLKGIPKEGAGASGPNNAFQQMMGGGAKAKDEAPKSKRTQSARLRTRRG